MTTGNSARDRRVRYAATGSSSLFRCFDCNGNKHTGGRRRVLRRGVAVWICEDCAILKGQT